MINIGDNEISGIYLGNSEISAIYAGDNQIYPMNLGTLTGIAIENLEWVKDVPASGGTATSANCEFNVYAYYDSGRRKRVTKDATITGSLVVPETSAETREMVGVLTLTATYSGFTDSDSVDVYQKAVTPDYKEMYFTFEILTNGTIKFSSNSSAVYNTISYRINEGTWGNITASSAGAVINVSAGDIVEFKGDNARYASGDGSGCKFSGSTSQFNVYGNIMSLINSTGFTTATTLTQNYAFCALFFTCRTVISAENLVLPATTLTTWCYKSMFHNASNLEKAPLELPALVLKDSCYRQMFLGTKITKTPIIAHTTAAQYCFGGMFESCTGLTDASGISFPSDSIAAYCYHYMFYNCRLLTTAPVLPAQTLTTRCYENMFVNCSSLTYIKCLGSNPSSNYTSNWVSGVGSTGTFVKLAGTSWPTGSSGIPNGWTVEYAY